MKLKRAGHLTTRFIVIGGGIPGAVVTGNPLPGTGAAAVMGAIEKNGVFSKEKDAEKVGALKQKFAILSHDTVDLNAKYR